MQIDFVFKKNEIFIKFEKVLMNTDKIKDRIEKFTTHEDDYL